MSSRVTTYLPVEVEPVGDSLDADQKDYLTFFKHDLTTIVREGVLEGLDTIGGRVNMFSPTDVQVKCVKECGQRLNEQLRLVYVGSGSTGAVREAFIALLDAIESIKITGVMATGGFVQVKYTHKFMLRVPDEVRGKLSISMMLCSMSLSSYIADCFIGACGWGFLSSIRRQPTRAGGELIKILARLNSLSVQVDKVLGRDLDRARVTRAVRHSAALVDACHMSVWREV